MIKVEFYVGLQYKADKSPLTIREGVEGMREVHSILNAAYGGFTRSGVQEGFYRGFPQESSVVFTCMAPGGSPVSPRLVAAKIAKAMHQESVLWFVTDGHGGFAKPPESNLRVMPPPEVIDESFDPDPPPDRAW